MPKAKQNKINLKTQTNALPFTKTLAVNPIMAESIVTPVSRI